MYFLYQALQIYKNNIQLVNYVIYLNLKRFTTLTRNFLLRHLLQDLLITAFLNPVYQSCEHPA